MRKHLAIVFFLALGLRLPYVLLAPQRPMSLDDSTQWNNTAMHFLRGEGFLTKAEELDPKRPPTYPLFMAANYLAFGPENFRAVKVSQAVLGAASCVILYGIASMLASPGIALGSALAMAAYPPLIVYTEILQSETLYIFLLLLFFFHWIRGIQKEKWVHFLVAGFIFGLLNLCRGTMLFFGIGMLGASLVLPWDRKFFVKTCALVAVSLAVVAPWSWRNYRVYGGILPIASGGSEMLWFGTLPWAEQRLFGLAPSFRAFTEIKNPVALEKAFSEAAKANIQADPAGYAALGLRKFGFFWLQPVGQKIAGRRFPLLGAALLGFHYALIALFLFGMIQTRETWRKFMPVYLLILYFTALHTVLAPEPRYRLPIEPFLLLFAVNGIASYLRFLDRNHASRA